MDQQKTFCPSDCYGSTDLIATTALLDANDNILSSSDKKIAIENCTNGSTTVVESFGAEQKEISIKSHSIQASSPATTPQYQVRQMRPEDVDQVLNLWKIYQLYEGKHTIQTFMAIDPDGFYVAEDLNTGIMIEKL